LFGFQFNDEVFKLFNFWNETVGVGYDGIKLVIVVRISLPISENHKILHISFKLAMFEFKVCVSILNVLIVE
jgi:hypothetical protein